ncbi:MAG: hypothetical protein ABH865_00385 [Candidatus Omnitrophota bacterium]
MNKKQSIIILVLLFIPIISCFAARDYLIDKGQKPDESTFHEYKIDLDGDKKPELIKVMYGPGVSDKYLEIEVYKAGKLISRLKGKFGIQSNYKIEDIDKDGKKEIIIWSGIWDPRLSGEDGVTEATYEGHSSPHRYIVATYKLIRDDYYLWKIYTTKKKYEPFCEEQPKE